MKMKYALCILMKRDIFQEENIKKNPKYGKEIVYAKPSGKHDKHI